MIGSDLEVLAEAKSVSFEFNEEVESIRLMFCGDGNDWGWAENEIEVNGTSVTVTLADLEGYDGFIAGTQGLFVLTVDYSTISATILKSAVLLMGGDDAGDSDNGGTDGGDNGDSGESGLTTTSYSPRVGDSVLYTIALVALLSVAFVTVKKVRVR